MRHLNAAFIIVAMIAVQFGVAHSAVCRSMMKTPVAAADHCARNDAPVQDTGDCDGAGCAELCRSKASEPPQASGKEIGGSPLAAPLDDQFPQFAPDGALGLESRPWKASIWKLAQSLKGQPPQAFILFHSLLI